MTPRPALSEGTNASFRRADQLAALTQGPPDDLSVRPCSRTGGIMRRREIREKGDAHKLREDGPSFITGSMSISKREWRQQSGGGSLGRLG